MRCGVSDEKRDAGTGQKNPAFGGPERRNGCVPVDLRAQAGKAQGTEPD